MSFKKGRRLFHIRKVEDCVNKKGGRLCHLIKVEECVILER